MRGTPLWSVKRKRQLAKVLCASKYKLFLNLHQPVGCRPGRRIAGKITWYVDVKKVNFMAEKPPMKAAEGC